MTVVIYKSLGKIIMGIKLVGNFRVSKKVQVSQRMKIKRITKTKLTKKIKRRRRRFILS